MKNQRKPIEEILYASQPRIDTDTNAYQHQQSVDDLYNNDNLQLDDEFTTNMKEQTTTVIGQPVIVVKHLQGEDYFAGPDNSTTTTYDDLSLHPAISDPNDFSHSPTPSIHLEYSPSPTPSLQFHSSPPFRSSPSPAGSIQSHLSARYWSAPSPAQSIVYHPSPSPSQVPYSRSPSPVPSLIYHPSPSPSGFGVSPSISPRIDLPSPQLSPSPVPSLRYHPSPSPSPVPSIQSLSSGPLQTDGRTSPLTSTLNESSDNPELHSIDPSYLFHPKPRSPASLLNFYSAISPHPIPFDASSQASEYYEGGGDKKNPTADLTYDKDCFDFEKLSISNQYCNKTQDENNHCTPGTIINTQYNTAMSSDTHLPTRDYECRVCNLHFFEDDQWRLHLKQHADE